MTEAKPPYVTTPIEPADAKTGFSCGKHALGLRTRTKYSRSSTRPRLPVSGKPGFFARSLRYLQFPEAIETLTPGERLLCMRDVQNPADSNAIALRNEKNALVGFCPGYLVDELAPLLREPEAVQVTVDESIRRLPPCSTACNVACACGLERTFTAIARDDTSRSLRPGFAWRRAGEWRGSLRIGTVGAGDPTIARTAVTVCYEPPRAS